MLKSILRTAAVAASFSMVSLSAGVSPVLAETLPTANIGITAGSKAS